MPSLNKGGHSMKKSMKMMLAMAALAICVLPTAHALVYCEDCTSWASCDGKQDVSKYNTCAGCELVCTTYCSGTGQVLCLDACKTWGGWSTPC